MRFEYCSEVDPNRYATALRLASDQHNLTWDSGRGQDCLLVQTAFGEDPIPRMSTEICPAINATGLEDGMFIEVLPGVKARHITAAEKARNGGCPLNGQACTYTVFATWHENDVCHVCMPRQQAMISPSCDIPLEIRVGMRKVTRMEGVLFRKREVDTGFWQLSFPRELSSEYSDGDIYYSIGQFKVPITRRVMEHGVAFVKSEVKPNVYAGNAGVRVV